MSSGQSCKREVSIFLEREGEILTFLDDEEASKRRREKRSREYTELLKKTTTTRSLDGETQIRME